MNSRGFIDLCHVMLVLFEFNSLDSQDEEEEAKALTVHSVTLFDTS